MHYTSMLLEGSALLCIKLAHAWSTQASDGAAPFVAGAQARSGAATPGGFQLPNFLQQYAQGPPPRLQPNQAPGSRLGTISGLHEGSIGSSGQRLGGTAMAGGNASSSWAGKGAGHKLGSADSPPQ